MNLSPIVFSVFGNEPLADSVCQQLGGEMGKMRIHTFPDEESSIEIKTLIKNRELIFIVNLCHPNAKILPLLFAADTARTLGAKKITLVSPYLPYMRQDIQFHPGESITSHYFSKLMSLYFDGLVTIDPHLHRIHDLNEIYSIPAKALHATACVGKWIKTHVPDGILIGPDEESSQWVSEIAASTHMPFTILDKIRYGDHQVDVSLPRIEPYHIYTPILVDDIISTANTMIETVVHLKSLHMKPPICIGVHALFSGDAYDKLCHAGVARVVTCNTIEHASNQIDVAEIIVAELSQMKI